MPIPTLAQQRSLLEMEYASEKEFFELKTIGEGLQRRIKRGDAWGPVSVGRAWYNSLNQPCIEIFKIIDDEEDSNFEPGRPVVFAVYRSEAMPGGGNQTRLQFLHVKGTVSFAEPQRLVVALENMQQAEALRVAGEGFLAVVLSFDETTFRTMFNALDAVLSAKNNRLAYLRDLFYSNQKAATFSFADIRFPWLNHTQQRAVNDILRAKDVMVVHGPPGTGKTTTLVEAIAETLRREPQVLVCAQSNMAVDWISEQLSDRGINVLRIGNPARVDDKMLSFTYERRFEAHPDYPQLWALRKAIRELRAGRKRGDHSFHQKLERLKSRAGELENRIHADIFNEARVIASTLVGSASRVLTGMKFGTVFIDEAAQALEAACWIPIRKASRVILAGDHCQLPPTVKSYEALRAGLGYTLMERIAASKPEVVALLEVQYRMNERIVQFSSDWFYHGKVQSHPSVRFRGILDYDEPILWIDTHGDDCREQLLSETYGRVNKTEADLTLLHLENYFAKIGRERILDERIDVAIISPYRAQVQYLRHRMKQMASFKPFRHLISINTVDGFQGQERDIVFISLVRANDDGQIGFLSDLRRMNVAITRARMKLIIMGDVATICRHKFYRQLYEKTKPISPPADVQLGSDGTEDER